MQAKSAKDLQLLVDHLTGEVEVLRAKLQTSEMRYESYKVSNLLKEQRFQVLEITLGTLLVLTSTLTLVIEPMNKDAEMSELISGLQESLDELLEGFQQLRGDFTDEDTEDATED